MFVSTSLVFTRGQLKDGVEHVRFKISVPATKVLPTAQRTRSSQKSGFPFFWLVQLPCFGWLSISFVSSCSRQMFWARISDSEIPAQTHKSGNWLMEHFAAEEPNNHLLPVTSVHLTVPGLDKRNKKRQQWLWFKTLLGETIQPRMNGLWRLTHMYPSLTGSQHTNHLSAKLANKLLKYFN